jgi:hypothetical protein
MGEMGTGKVQIQLSDRDMTGDRRREDKIACATLRDPHLPRLDHGAPFHCLMQAWAGHCEALYCQITPVRRLQWTFARCSKRLGWIWSCITIFIEPGKRFNFKNIYTADATPCKRPHECSMGPSASRGCSPSTRTDPCLSRGSRALMGGLTSSLKRNVPYTKSAKPTTCNHLKVSHPSPRDTSQMNNVRQVSMIDLEVAEMLLVTDKPKKLKPPMETIMNRLEMPIARLLKTSR